MNASQKRARRFKLAQKRSATNVSPAVQHGRHARTATPAKGAT